VCPFGGLRVDADWLFEPRRVQRQHGDGRGKLIVADRRMIATIVRGLFE